MSRRFKVAGFLALLAAAWGAWLVFGPSGPPRPITIGKATTFVTGPLEDNGDVDFEAALNDRLGEGVTPDANAVVNRSIARSMRCSTFVANSTTLPGNAADQASR